MAANCWWSVSTRARCRSRCSFPACARAPPHRVRGRGVPYRAYRRGASRAAANLLTARCCTSRWCAAHRGRNEDSPRVSPDRRFEVEAYGDGFFRVILHFGFMEGPNIPAALRLCHLNELDFRPMRTTYFLSRGDGDSIQAHRHGALARGVVRLPAERTPTATCAISTCRSTG
ncbi:KUP/HAK/KT family potassium transporter [Pseudomonas aeruginosa]